MSIRCAVFAAFVGCLSLAAAHAEDVLSVARRNQELAELRLRQYEKVEYPLAAKRLDNEIKLVAAELEVQQRRIKELGPNSVFKYSEAFGVSLDEARLGALRAELRLGELKDERMLLERYKSDRFRLLQLELDAAAAEVRALVNSK